MSSVTSNTQVVPRAASAAPISTSTNYTVPILLRIAFENADGKLFLHYCQVPYQDFLLVSSALETVKQKYDKEIPPVRQTVVRILLFKRPTVEIAVLSPVLDVSVLSKLT